MGREKTFMRFRQNADAIYKKMFKRTFFSQRLLKNKLKQFKKTRNQDTCFILGNGPSLTWELVQRLECKVTFAFNKIYLMPEVTGIDWHPTFYMVEDDLVLNQNHLEIASFCKRNPKMISFFRFYRKSVYANIYNLFQYNYVDDETKKFSFRPWHEVVSGQSVVYSAIQVAISMGFKRIVLLGVDFNFGEYNARTAADGVILGAQEKTHFSTNYRKKNEKWNPPNLEKQKRFFEFARSIIPEIGVEIIDCTPNGKLGVFPQKNIDEVLRNG